MKPSQRHQEREAEQFFCSVYGQDAPGFAALWTKQDRLTRYVEANAPGEIARTVTRLAERQDVYFGVGLQPRDLGAHRRGEGKDVVGMPGFWADIDVRGPAHKDIALPPTKEAALALLDKFALPPSLVVDSGHGLQPWWLFEKPWIFRDEDERREAQTLVQRFQATLQKIANSYGWRMDNTSDLARVMRPPGSWNHKLEPVPVRLLEVDYRAGNYRAGK